MSKNIMHVTVLDEASAMVTPIRFTTYEVPITINIRKQLFPCSTMYLKTQIGTTLDFIHESGISSNTATYMPTNTGINGSLPAYTAKVSPIKPPVPNIVLGLALEIDMGTGWGFFDAGIRYKNYVNGISNLSLVYTDDAHANEKFNIGKSGFVQFELRYYLPDFKHFTAY